MRGISNLLRIRLPHGWIALLPALAAFGYILFGAVRGKENFKVHQVTYVSPDLPDAFDGYRILQLSDIHSGSWKGYGHALQRAIDLCNAQHPDLAVFTGDLVNSRADELTEFVPVLSQLRAKDGVFSVLGNHDYGTYTRWESELDRIANVDSLIVRENRMGWQMLMNSHRILHRGNDSIALAGVENSGAPPFPDYANLSQALQGTEGMFKILLSHDPTHWRIEILPESDVHADPALRFLLLPLRLSGALRHVPGRRTRPLCERRSGLCSFPHAPGCVAGNYTYHLTQK